MQDAGGTVLLRYFGLAIYEIEVLYDSLSRVFSVLEEHEDFDPGSSYVSCVEIEFPVPFNESFFLLIGLDTWNRIKGVIKEMKRRRGGKGIKVLLAFRGISTPSNMKLIFSLQSGKVSEFNNAIERIEYLVDVIPFQIGDVGEGVDKIVYAYDELSFKWVPHVSPQN